MNDTNVRLGMVPHRSNCCCDECENERLRKRIAELERKNAELRSVLLSVRNYPDIHMYIGNQLTSAIDAAIGKETKDE